MNSTINDPKNYIIINGSEKSLHLPEKVDKIIMRNTYHHFSNKKTMMKSIKSSLKKNGYLLLKESLASEDYSSCNKRLTEPKLKKEMKKYGFIIVEELLLDDSLFLKLVPQ